MSKKKYRRQPMPPAVAARTPSRPIGQQVLAAARASSGLWRERILRLTTTAARKLSSTGRATTQRVAEFPLRQLMLLFFVFALIFSVGAAGLEAYHEYRTLRDLASGGLAALKRVPGDIGLSGQKLSGQHISATQEHQARADIALALHDFTALHENMDHPGVALSLAANTQQGAQLITSVTLLSSIAIDVATIGQDLIDGLISVVNALSDSSLLGTTPTAAMGSGLTLTDLATIQTGYAAAKPYLADLLTRLQTTAPGVLFAALTAKQRTTVQPFLSLLPQVPALLPVIDQLFPVAAPILGISQPANYLVVTMDPAEIRATGGFQGNYAVLGVDGARPSNFNLNDIYQIDRHNGIYVQNPVPDAYQSWWPFRPWGVRDANLSPDFPTTAAYSLNLLQSEDAAVVPITDASGATIGERPVQMTGMIAIEPHVIEQLLTITGPIQIGAPYNETVTAQNLQARIHYYQLTNAGRAIGNQADPTLSSVNKRFTALIGRALIARLKALPRSDLLQFGQVALADLHSKDIQVYFTNPQAEQLLRDYQDSSELYTGADDALAINESNIAGNKGDAYLSQVVTDDIQLDMQGGATHNLTIEYAWAPPNIVDGYDEDAIYNVLYNTDKIDVNGLFMFQYDRIYTAPDPQPGDASGFLNGGIETTQSDFAARGMLAAHYYLRGDPTQVPVTWNVPVVHVSWHVDHVFTPGKIYTLHLQSQAGAPSYANVTISLPASCPGSSVPAIFSGALTTNWVLPFTTASCPAAK